MWKWKQTIWMWLACAVYSRRDSIPTLYLMFWFRWLFDKYLIWALWATLPQETYVQYRYNNAHLLLSSNSAWLITSYTFSISTTYLFPHIFPSYSLPRSVPSRKDSTEIKLGDTNCFYMIHSKVKLILQDYNQPRWD